MFLWKILYIYIYIKQLTIVKISDELKESLTDLVVTSSKTGHFVSIIIYLMYFCTCKPESHVYTESKPILKKDESWA